MFNVSYDMPLKIMMDENCPLATIIEEFMSSIPDPMKEKITHGVSKYRKTKDDKAWYYVDDGTTMNISLGSAKNFKKEYFNLSINKNNYESIFNKTLNGFGEVDLGFFTIYIPSSNRKEAKEAAIFEFVLKRKREMCCIDIKTRFNIESNREILKKVGFTDEDIDALLKSRSYSVNLEETTKSKNKSKKM